MLSKFKPISISLSPNVEKDDVHLALNLIIRPWLWRTSSSLRGRSPKQSQPQRLLRRLWAPRNDAVLELEEQFKKYLGVKYAFSFNSGRSAFYAILKALNEVEGLKRGDGVALQAFTCNAAINPILWADLKPIYIDCNKDDFNLDVSDLKAKITLQQAQGGAKTKVLMVQHTFGLPANMDEIMAIASSRRSSQGEGGCDPLILIEDCAHSLGAEYKGQKVGTFGKAAFFSFSRDKIISSVYGGMAVTNDDILGKKLEELQKEFGQPTAFWIFQQLLHPILLNYIILPIYNFFDLGKIFLVLSQWFHILSKAVHWKEKRGVRPDYFPKALPNALAIMAQNQLFKLDKFYKHRKQLSRFYYENLKGTSFSVSDNLLPENLSVKNIKHSFLRFTVKHPKAHEIIYDAWHKQNILLGDWYTTPIAPADTRLDRMRYKMGSCPTAERLSKITLNLPTHINISKSDVEKIVDFLKKWK